MQACSEESQRLADVLRSATDTLKSVPYINCGFSLCHPDGHDVSLWSSSDLRAIQLSICNQLVGLATSSLDRHVSLSITHNRSYVSEMSLSSLRRCILCGIFIYLFRAALGLPHSQSTVVAPGKFHRIAITAVCPSAHDARAASGIVRPLFESAEHVSIHSIASVSQLTGIRNG